MKPRCFYKLLCITLCMSVLACNSGSERQKAKEASENQPREKSVPNASKYPPHVGDITFDESRDNSAFQPCSRLKIPQYYALGAKFRVSNKVLLKHFSGIEMQSDKKTAYHTIRFLVNCRGKTGRYREQSMLPDYTQIQLDTTFTEELKQRLKSFNKWPQGRDYYQYLTFKIVDGKITEVLP